MYSDVFRHKFDYGFSKFNVSDTSEREWVSYLAVTRSETFFSSLCYIFTSKYQLPKIIYFDTNFAMVECFVPSVPTSQWKKSAFSADVCRSRNSVLNKPRAKNVPTMTSDNKAPKKPEEKGLAAWVYRKMMHNALWDGDENVGYEPFFKDAMDAREAKKQEEYEKGNGSS